MDVNTAFLYGELEETIFMKQLEGFIEKGKEHQVCLLRKSLYGLKQSPRQWNKRFDKFMVNNNFFRSGHDNCIYFKEVNNDCIVYLLLYVDDILIACESKSEIQKLKQVLSSEFDMKDLGSAQKILGIEIRRERHLRKLYLSQKDYLEKVLVKFGMVDSKPVLTPLSAQFKLKGSHGEKSEDDRAYMSKIPYANILDQLCMQWSALDQICHMQ